MVFLFYSNFCLGCHVCICWQFGVAIIFYLFIIFFYPIQPSVFLPQTHHRLASHRSDVDAHFNSRTDITTSPERNPLKGKKRKTKEKGFTIFCVQRLHNVLTHSCVYRRVFSVASRVVAGCCRSFLRLPAAGRGGGAVFWGGGFPAVSQRGPVQRSTGPGTAPATRLFFDYSIF